MERRYTEAELRLAPSEEIASLGRSLGVEGRERTIRAALDAQAPWWRAMRRLRALRRFEGLSDDFIIDAVESEMRLGVGGAKPEDLNRFWGVFARGPSSIAKMPLCGLTRSEVLTELGKTVRFWGLGHLQIEKELSDEVMTKRELVSILLSHGGPSSSCPERVRPDVEGAVWSLKKEDRFRNMTGGEIFRDANAVRRNLPELEQVADGFRYWKRKAEASGSAVGDPLELMNRLRTKEPFRGMTDQEIVEKGESLVGTRFAGFGDLSRISGSPERAGAPPRNSPPPRPCEWWNAVRKVRTLRVPEVGNVSEAVANHYGIRKEDVGTRDVLEFYDTFRGNGLHEEAKSPVPLARRELISELSKFERYEGASPEETARLFGGTTEALEERLKALGGPAIP